MKCFACVKVVYFLMSLIFAFNNCFSQDNKFGIDCENVNAVNSNLFVHDDGTPFVLNEFYDSIIYLEGQKFNGTIKICSEQNIQTLFSYRYGLLHGSVKTFDTTGVLRECNYYDSSRFTYSEHYYENGSIERKGAYEKKNKSGVWIYYYPNLRIRTIEDYSNNISGKWFYFFENGQLLKIEEYLNSKKNGEFVHYYENGTISSVEYWKDNLKNGTWKYYFENAQTWKVENYVNGVEEGNWTEYYINGNIKEQIQFKNEVFDGERKEYYENGILKTYQNWGEGQKNGYCYYYNEKGKVICEEQYRNGILINKKGHF